MRKGRKGDGVRGVRRERGRREVFVPFLTLADDLINSSTAVLSITPPALARSAAVSLIPLQ